METKREFRKVKLLRRLGSAFIDLILVLIISVLFSYVSKPIINNAFDSDNVYDRFYNYAIDTKLYSYNEDKTNVVVNYNLSDADERITYFYNNCTDDKIDEYIELKKSSTLFNKVGEEYIEISYDINDSDAKQVHYSFYTPIIDNCISMYLDNYLNTIDDYRNCLNTINKINYTSLIVNFSFGLLVSFILIPLLSKKGRTLGKMMFKISIISLASKETNPTKLQILFRELTKIFFEYLTSIATIGYFGIPLPVILIVSIVMALLTKYNQSFHDLLTKTFLVDELSFGPINEGDKYIVTYKD